MVDLGISHFLFVSIDFIETEGSVHPQCGLLCDAALPRKTKTYVFMICSMLLLENGPNLRSNRGTIHKTGIMEAIQFWWVP